MAAIEKAWEVGAHGVEVDLRVTADGEFIIIHDNSLVRTTDIHRILPDRLSDPIDSFSLAELRQLDSGSWFVDKDPFGEIAAGRISPNDLSMMTQQQIPTLQEAVNYVKKRSWFINIELKELPRLSHVGEVLELLDKLGLPPSMFSLSSFNHDYLRLIQKLRPDLEINALIGDNTMMAQDWGAYEFVIYNANAELTDEEQIARALDHGCSVNLYTVNEPDQMRRFLKCGVDKIITDFPQRLALLNLK